MKLLIKILTVIQINKNLWIISLLVASLMLSCIVHSLDLYISPARQNQDWYEFFTYIFIGVYSAVLTSGILFFGFAPFITAFLLYLIIKKNKINNKNTATAFILLFLSWEATFLLGLVLGNS